jgi:hypothetical protein
MYLRSLVGLIILVLIAFLVFLTFYGDQAGAFLISGSNNTIITTIGLGNAFYVTGSDSIDWGKKLQLFFEVLGILALVVIDVYYLILAPYFQESRDEGF